MAVSWTTIPDSDVDPESPITTSLMQALRDNPEGIAGGASGAPKIITGAITDGAVTEAKLGASAVNQAALKLGIQQTTGSLGAGGFVEIQFTGGYYTLGWGLGDSAAALGDAGVHGHDDGTYANKVVYFNGDGSTRNYYFAARYFSASPPYDLGDGEVPLFIFVKLNGGGNIIGVDVAPDAPWHYNGPTKITPDIVEENGKKFLYQKTKPVIDPFLDLNGYLAELGSLNAEKIEITQAIKQADMDLIPHPFGRLNGGETVVLLDPVSDNMWKLAELHGDVDIGKLLMGGAISIDNAALNRITPLGLKTVGFSF